MGEQRTKGGWRERYCPDWPGHDDLAAGTADCQRPQAIRRRHAGEHGETDRGKTVGTGHSADLLAAGVSEAKGIAAVLFGIPAEGFSRILITPPLEQRLRNLEGVFVAPGLRPTELV